jgi:hypothetical protein
MNNILKEMQLPTLLKQEQKLQMIINMSIKVIKPTFFYFNYKKHNFSHIRDQNAEFVHQASSMKLHIKKKKKKQYLRKPENIKSTTKAYLYNNSQAYKTTITLA